MSIVNNFTKSQRNQIIEFYFLKRKTGMDNSCIRKDMLANGISLKVTSKLITEIDTLYTIPKNKGLLDFIKKSHARIRIVLGILMLVIGLGSVFIQYWGNASVIEFKGALIVMIAGIGSYSTGVYSLRKANRQNKKFSTTLKPMDRNYLGF